MGLYAPGHRGSFPDFGIRMTRAIFHETGIRPRVRVSFTRSRMVEGSARAVRATTSDGTRSSPGALLVLIQDKARRTRSSLMQINLRVCAGAGTEEPRPGGGRGHRSGNRCCGVGHSRGDEQ